MKILPILLIGGLVFVSTTEIVAGADDANSQILLQKIKADKKLVVAGNMGLTDEEARKFWPLYEEYQKELERLNLKLGETIREYAAAYNKGPLSDDTAKKLMDEALSVEESETNLKRTYAGKIGKVIPAAKTARYIQIEQKIRAMLRAELAQEIPLIP